MAKLTEIKETTKCKIEYLNSCSEWVKSAWNEWNRVIEEMELKYELNSTSKEAENVRVFIDNNDSVWIYREIKKEEEDSEIKRWD